MLQIKNISDFSQLQQVALLLQKENDRLHKRLEELSRENSHLKGTDGEKQLALEIEKLQSQMSKLQKMMFGPSSERRKTDKEDEKEKKSKEQAGHGPSSQPELPKMDVELLVPYKDRICNLCGGELEEWEGQDEESEDITVIERQFVLRAIKRKKFRCKCGACIKTAPPIKRPIPGGRYSTEFAVEVAIDKYLDHMPLERQTRKMKREGLRITSQTLWDQIWALSGVLRPVYDKLLPYIFTFSVICADESIWYLLQKGGRKKWYIWGAACPFAVYYHLDPSRSGKVAEDLLSEYRGKIITDGYQGYKGLARDGPSGDRIELVNCWSHARRKFVECEDDYPVECKEALEMIGELYKIEDEVPNAWHLPEDEREAIFALLAEIRETKSRPITEKLKSWAHKQLSLPESTFRSAVEYLLGHWYGLTKFLDDPHVPIDNNHIERGFRGPAVGRKNHYGSKSKRGTEVAAIFYSLIESAKLCGLDPKAYLREATRVALQEPGTALMPHEMREVN